MFQRFDLRPLARHHFASLIDPGRRRISAGTALVIFILPAILGALGGWAIPLPADGTAPAGFAALPAAGGTLVAGFLAAFVLLMNLRIKLDESPQLSRTPSQLRSISAAAMSSLYLTMASGAALVVSIVLVIFGGVMAAGAPLAFQIMAGLDLAIFVHILVNAVTVLRRASGAYFVMYQGEVKRMPVRSVPDSDRRAS